MMMAAIISIIPIILIHTLFYVGLSDDLPLTTPLPQSPTSFFPPFHRYHQISNSYSPSDPLEESKRRSPPPKKRSPPPPRRSPPPPPPRLRSPPPPPKKKSPPPPRPSPPPPPPLSFDHFKLSQTWPPTYCRIKNNDCVSPPPQKFTIHGLWPSNKDDTEIRDCRKDYINPNDFFPLKNKLEKDWPALFKKIPQGDANIQFWTNQWNAHGTCSEQLFKLIPYFNETLMVYDRNSIKDILEKNGTKPGGTYPRQNILNAIHDHTKFKPQIRCERINNVDYLYEIRLCLTATKELIYEDCHFSYSGCRDRVTF